MKRLVPLSLALILVALMALGATATFAQNGSASSTPAANTGTPSAGTGTPAPAIGTALHTNIDLCGKPLSGAIGGVDATPTYAYPSSYSSSSYSNSSGYMGNNEQLHTPAPTPTATPLPQPINPVNKSCENGKILIAVATDRHGTYRIGDVVGLDVYISTTADVQINFDNLLKDNILVFDTSTFELVDTPTVETTTAKERIQHHLHLRVRSFSTVSIQYVSVDLLYATATVDNAPAWKRLSTPPLMITTTRTLDQGTSPLEGDVQERASAGTWLSMVLIASGALLVFLTLVPVAVRQILAILRRPRPVHPNAQIWIQLDTALNRGKAKGFTRQDYGEISSALRTFLAREPATLKEIEIVSNADERLNDIRSALRKLDSIVFAPQHEERILNAGELAQLERELERIVPRPGIK